MTTSLMSLPRRLVNMEAEHLLVQATMQTLQALLAPTPLRPLVLIHTPHMPSPHHPHKAVSRVCPQEDSFYTILQYC